MGNNNSQYTSINPLLTGIKVTDKVNTNLELKDLTLLSILNKFLLLFYDNVKLPDESVEHFLLRKLANLDEEAFRNLLNVLKLTEKVILEAKLKRLQSFTSSRPLSEAEALYSTIYEREVNKDGSFGNFKNFGVASRVTMSEAKLIAEEKLNEEYVLLLAKALTAYDEEDEDKILEENDKLKNLIVSIIKSNGYSEEEANLFWDETILENYSNSNSLKDWTTLLIGEKILDDREYAEFVNADSEDKLGILATHIKSNPYYETITSKFKKKIDKENEETLVSNVYSDLLDKFNYYNVSNSKGLDVFPTFFNKLAAGMGIVAMSAPTLVDSVTSGIVPFSKKLISETNEEESDNLISTLSDNYMTKRSLALYESLTNLSLELKDILIKDYKDLSEEKSGIYKINKDNYITDIDLDDYLREIAKFLTKSEIFGLLAAENSVISFWTNTSAERLTKLDKVLNTGITFANSFVSDVLSFTAATLGNVVYLFYNPETGKFFDLEGYSDALVLRNWLMLYALAILETGAYTEELLNKYREAGVNAALIYLSEADLNSVFAASDLWNAVGLYGFTAATSLMSIGGSALIKAAVKKGINASAKAVTKKAVKELTKRGVKKKVAKEMLKDGLETEFTKTEIAAFKEALAKDLSKKIYRGNLILSGALGTGEGALEAKTTYNEFIALLTERVKDIQAYNKSNINNLSDSELISGALKLKDAGLFETKGIVEKVLTPEGDLEYSFISSEGKELVKKALLDNSDTITELRLLRVKDDAADAAMFNFMSNSAINGMINVFFKSALLSKDAATASKILTRGKKGITDMITVRNVRGVWQAAVRKDASLLPKITKSNVVLIMKGTGRTMIGEGLEEYTLNISNVVSLAAMKLDMENYIKTALDEESAAAFNTNIYDSFNAALDAFGSLLTDTLAIKEGILGGLSSTIGGLSPNRIRSRSSWAKPISRSNSISTNTKNILSNIGNFFNNLYDGGIKAAYLENKLERASELLLVEHINSWLNNSKNLELILSLLSSIGFQKAMNESLELGDIFSAKDNKLNLAIENAVMLKALEGTDYANLINREITNTAELSEIAKDDNNFNDENNYIGDDNSVKSALISFRNSEGRNSRSMSINDRDALTRMGENALEFLKLLTEVKKAYKKLDEIFKDSDIDPVVKKAFASAMILSKKAGERADKLKEERLLAETSDNLTELEKLKLSGKTDKSIEEIAILYKYGNLDGALKALNNLLLLLAAFDYQSKKQPTSGRNKAIKAIKNEIKVLKKEIDLYRNILGERYINGAENLEEARKILLKPSKERDDAISKYELNLTVEDISSLDEKEISALFLNKESLTAATKAAMSEYVELLRKGSLNEENRETLTAKDIELNLIDEGALKLKSTEYERSILDFIQNPSFLNDVAVAQRTNLRRDVVRYLYRDIIEEGKTENPIVAIENMISKTRELTSLGKEFDANLLRLEVEKREDVLRIKKSANEFSLNLLASEKRDDEKRNKVIALIETLSSVTKKSYSDIKKLFDNNDTVSITNLLTTQLADGSYVYNHFLSMLNPNATYDITTLLGIDDLLLLSKNLISRPKPTALNKPLNTVSETLHRPTLETLQRKPTSTREDLSLRVITPGDIELNSPLSKYFRENKVSRNLYNLANGKDVKLLFMIDSEYRDPSTIFVVLLNKKTNEMNIVGAIQADSSSTLGLAAALARASKLLGRIILKNNASEVGVTINSIKDAHHKTSRDRTGALPIGSIFRGLYSKVEEVLKAIRDWATLIVGSNTETALGIVSWNSNGLRLPSLTFLDFLISKVKNPNNGLIDKDLRDFPIQYEDKNGLLVNSTLAEFMVSPFMQNSDLESIAKVLRLNEYLASYLDTWKFFNSSKYNEGNGAYDVYKKLIKPFVHLGSIKAKDNDKIVPLIYIDSDTNKKYLTLDIYRNNGQDVLRLELELPSPTSDSDNEQLAIEFLKNVLTATDKDGDSLFSNYDFQIPYEAIGNSRTSTLSNIELTSARNLAIRLLLGLALADMIEGFVPEAISRELTLTNPFYKKLKHLELTTDRDASSINPLSLPNHIEETANGKPKLTIFEKAKLTLDKLPELCRLIVSSIIKDSEELLIHLLDSNSEFYTGKDGNRARVTSLKLFFRGSKSLKFDRDESTKNISTAFGNTIDMCIRSIIEFINTKDGVLDYKTLIPEAIQYIKDSNELQKIPNYEDFLILKFIGSIILFCLVCKLNEWDIVPNGIVAFGKVPIFSGDSLVSSKEVAGTLDLLVYDKDGFFHIIDIKTMHNNDNKLESKIETRKYDWEILVATYEYLLKLRHPEMKFGLHYILPIGVSYPAPLAGVTPLVNSDGMTVTNYKASGTPVTLTISRTTLNPNLEDFLYPLSGPVANGFELKLELNKLDLLEDVMEVSSLEEQPTEYTKVEEENGLKKEDYSSSMGFDYSSDDFSDLDDESRRSVTLLRSIDYFNKYIAPIKRLKMSTTSKAISFILKLVKDKNTVKAVVEHELASMLFNGDMNKLLIIAGNKALSSLNYQEIVDRSKKYFLNYVNNKLSYIEAATRRYLARKATYNFLKDNITLLELLDILKLYNILFLDIEGLLDVILNPNDTKLKLSLLNTLESSKSYTELYYLNLLDEILNTIDDMETKLGFLNLDTSISSIMSRITSVKLAIYDDAYDISESPTRTVEDVKSLFTKLGARSASTILKNIISNSKDKFTLAVALLLLREVHKKGLNIKVSIGESLDLSLEGVTRGKIITIFNNSLDSYEHFERVALHELIHAVIEKSPEMIDLIDKTFKTTLLLYADNIGSTILEVQSSIYGFKNVNEFISEFFTNRLFLELLKDVLTDKNLNAFDMFIKTAQNIFAKTSSRFSLVESVMESIINTSNIYVNKAKPTVKKTSKNRFKTLSKEALLMINDRGISAKEYNSWTTAEQEFIEKCCR